MPDTLAARADAAGRPGRAAGDDAAPRPRLLCALPRARSEEAAARHRRRARSRARRSARGAAGEPTIVAGDRARAASVRRERSRAACRGAAFAGVRARGRSRRSPLRCETRLDDPTSPTDDPTSCRYLTRRTAARLRASAASGRRTLGATARSATPRRWRVPRVPYPFWSPDGRSVAFFVGSAAQTARSRRRTAADTWRFAHGCSWRQLEHRGRHPDWPDERPGSGACPPQKAAQAVHATKLLPDQQHPCVAGFSARRPAGPSLPARGASGRAFRKIARFPRNPEDWERRHSVLSSLRRTGCCSFVKGRLLAQRVDLATRRVPLAKLASLPIKWRLILHGRPAHSSSHLPLHHLLHPPEPGETQLTWFDRTGKVVGRSVRPIRTASCSRHCPRTDAASRRIARFRTLPPLRPVPRRTRDQADVP